MESKYRRLNYKHISSIKSYSRIISLNCTNTVRIRVVNGKKKLFFDGIKTYFAFHYTIYKKIHELVTIRLKYVFFSVKIYIDILV